MNQDVVIELSQTVQHASTVQHHMQCNLLMPDSDWLYGMQIYSDKCTAKPVPDRSWTHE